LLVLLLLQIELFEASRIVENAAGQVRGIKYNELGASIRSRDHNRERSERRTLSERR
jgi:hypothetical protein